MTQRSYPCECCGYHTLGSPAGASYQLCPVCGWEDSEPVDLRGTPQDGSNGIHLEIAQERFERCGFCDETWSDTVRPPTADEARAASWETLAQTRRRLLDGLTLFPGAEITGYLKYYSPLAPLTPYGQVEHYGDRWEDYIIEFEQTEPFIWPFGSRKNHLRSYLAELMHKALSGESTVTARELIEVRDLLAEEKFRDTLDKYSLAQKLYLAELLSYITNPWIVGADRITKRAVEAYWHQFRVRRAGPRASAESADPGTQKTARGTPGVDKQALLSAVYADPDDLAARRALAAQLIEAGDPRGELISLQLARQDPGRVAQLLARYRNLWIGDLAMISESSSVVFSQGFPAEITVCMANRCAVRACSMDPAWATIRVLRFDDGALEAPHQQVFPTMTGLAQIIGLRPNGLASLQDVPAPVLARLRTLVVDAGRASHSTPSSVAQTLDTLAQVWARCRALQEVRVSGVPTTVSLDQIIRLLESGRRITLQRLRFDERSDSLEIRAAPDGSLERVILSIVEPAENDWLRALVGRLPPGWHPRLGVKVSKEPRRNGRLSELRSWYQQTTSLPLRQIS